MSNWFAGINQAASGLNAARYGLTVVSQNISNADTPGYTRQISNQVATDGALSAGLNTARSGQSSLWGVKVISTDRADDPVLDARVRNEHARGANMATTSAQFTDLEGLFPEPSTSALGAQLNTFWSSWASVANNPDAASGTRAVLLTNANTVVNSLHSLSSSFDTLQTSTAASLQSDIDTANTAAAQLAVVNGQITIAVATGSTPNSLLDQRDQLLDQLSSLVGGTATFDASGAATVSVGGQQLVTGPSASTLAVDSAYQVSVGGSPVSLSSSSASARVTALTSTLPTYRAQLDGVANALSGAVNAIQGNGYDLSGAAGQPMFGGSGAGGITVTLTDPNGIAAASTPGGNLDGSNALLASRGGAAAGSADSAYAALVGQVAMASSLAQQQQTTQGAVVANVDGLKSSVSGVSYDEEVSNMLTYQRAFEASSRVLTTLDSMLDTLINHTGAGS